MHIITGGNGHVGAAVASSLLAQGEAVALVVRDAGRAQAWCERVVQIIEADVGKPDQLGAAFSRGRPAFLLDPPADASSDAGVVERQTVANILKALDGSGLEKVVAASTAGAQAGHRIGDLSVLQARTATPTHCRMHPARDLLHEQLGRAARRGAPQGQTLFMFPADLPIPMVSPLDLGSFAAQRMMSSTEDLGLTHV